MEKAEKKNTYKYLHSFHVYIGYHKKMQKKMISNDNLKYKRWP